jgi:perosamine synthetase
LHSNLEQFNDPLRPLPRGPVLDWASFQRIKTPRTHSIENLKQKVLTTSGRAAIYQALLQLKLPANSFVLVPTYHCPTMVAPVLLAKLNVAYFGLLPSGLPQLDSIEESTAKKCKAMLVPHYFGLAKSLKDAREWCNKRNIALIEDCAHCYFGDAGEKSVGEWGDFATASLSKFLPVPEAGMLASSTRAIDPLFLEKPPLKAQIKGWVDVIELASSYHKFFGFRYFLNKFFKLKNIRSKPQKNHNDTEKEIPDMMRDCDMARIQQAPLWAAIALKAALPHGRIIAQRQKNFSHYGEYFNNISGARPLFSCSEKANSPVAPYVYPLWVDEPDTIYQSLRELRLPVFRWDRIWPDTPYIPGDVGTLWSHHVLQLLCHQDLNQTDIDRTARAILHLLQIQQKTRHASEPNNT